MKKFAIGSVALLIGLMLTACPGAPLPAPAPVVEEAPAPAPVPAPAPYVDQAVAQVQEAHRPYLDLTGAQTYIVVQGDTLSEIARRFFGGITNVGDAGFRNGFYFPVIMIASVAHIPDPDLIQPGTVLTIPDLRRNLDNPGARQAIIQSLFQIADIYQTRPIRALDVVGLRMLANSL